MPAILAPATGTISIAAGSTDIVGTGTTFTIYRRGALFNAGGLIGFLADDPADDTHASLVLPISTSAITDAAFAVMPISDSIAQAERVRQLVELLSNGTPEELAALELVANRLLGTDDSGALTLLNVPAPPGAPYTFDASTDVATDPGAGKFRFDSATAPTVLVISKTDSGGGSRAGMLAKLDDSNNAVRSIISLAPTDGAGVQLRINVTGTVVDHAIYVTVPIAIDDFALPATGAKLALSASPSGNDGTNGAPGADGEDGANGVLNAIEVVKTSNYSIAATDNGKTLVANSASAIGFTFAAAATLTSTFMVLVGNRGTGALTLTPSASEQIDGAANLVLQQGMSAIIYSDGGGLRSQLVSYGATAAKALTNLGFSAFMRTLLDDADAAAALATLGAQATLGYTPINKGGDTGLGMLTFGNSGGLVMNPGSNANGQRYSIDAAGNTVSVADGAGLFFPAAQFSGFILVDDLGTGSVGIFLAGGNAITLVAQTQSGFAGTVTSGKIGANFNSGNGQYYLSNNTGATHTISVFLIRMRTFN
jgi:hypothetical protein